MKKAILLFPLIAVFFSCSSKMEISIPENDSLSESYTLHLPDLDPTKYALTHVFIELEIQGNNYPFIIDTGDRYGTLKISQKTSEKIEHTLLGETRKSKSLYGKNEEEYCQISDIKIGDLAINNLPCIITEDSWFWPWNTVYEDIGMIGWGLLREFNLYLDFPNQELCFYSHGIIPKEVESWNVSEYRESENMISLSGTFNDSSHKYSLLIDTGAGQYTEDGKRKSLFLDSLFPRVYKKVQSSTTTESGRYLQANFVSQGIRIEEMNMGKMHVSWFLSYEYDGFLGWGFFWNHKVFFDNENHRLYMKI